MLWIRIPMDLDRIQIRIQESKSDPKIQNWCEEISCFEVLDVRGAEVFSCSLNDHYGGLGISNLPF